MNKPITPALHAAIDYAATAMFSLAPSVLNFNTPAISLCYAFAGAQGSLSALTDQPLALSPLVPLRTHGTIDMAMLPVQAVLPMVTGANKQPRARYFFLAMLGISVALTLLTDFDAHERSGRSS